MLLLLYIPFKKRDLFLWRENDVLTMTDIRTMVIDPSHEGVLAFVVVFVGIQVISIEGLLSAGHVSIHLELILYLQLLV